MPRKPLIMGFLVLALLGFSVVSADWQYTETLYDDTHLFVAYSTPYPHHWEIHFNLTAGDRLLFIFNASDVIEFWISDKENYVGFEITTEESYPYLCYSIYSYQAPVTDFSGEFLVPQSGEWYFVFVNEYAPEENRTIQLSIDRYQWEGFLPLMDPNVFLGPIVLFVGILCAIVLLVVVSLRLRQSQNEI
ncbi:MAG: hypothetical protein ACFFCH_09770 [Promethearchaeota archaeon]